MKSSGKYVCMGGESYSQGLSRTNPPIPCRCKRAGSLTFVDGSPAKAWKEIWGCGQGIGVINKVQGAAAFVAQLQREYAQARARLAL